MSLVSVEESLVDINDNNNYDQLTLYEKFDYALKSQEVRRQYPKILKIHLNDIKFELSEKLRDYRDNRKIQYN
jgi:hypothetical protein